MFIFVTLYFFIFSTVSFLLTFGLVNGQIFAFFSFLLGYSALTSKMPARAKSR